MTEVGQNSSQKSNTAPSYGGPNFAVIHERGRCIEVYGSSDAHLASVRAEHPGTCEMLRGHVQVVK